MGKLGKVANLRSAGGSLVKDQACAQGPECYRKRRCVAWVCASSLLNPVPVPEVDDIVTAVGLDKAEKHYELAGGRMRPWHDVSRCLQVSRGYKV
jgi:hypothetical protein